MRLWLGCDRSHAGRGDVLGAGSSARRRAFPAGCVEGVRGEAILRPRVGGGPKVGVATVGIVPRTVIRICRARGGLSPKLGVDRFEIESLTRGDGSVENGRCSDTETLLRE